MKKVREIRSHVASDFLLWREPLSRLPQGGEANTNLKQNIDLESRQSPHLGKGLLRCMHENRKMLARTQITISDVLACMRAIID